MLARFRGWSRLRQILAVTIATVFAGFVTSATGLLTTAGADRWFRAAPRISEFEVSVAGTSHLSEQTDHDGVTHSYRPDQVLDDDPETAWAEGAPGDGVGETLTFTFKRAIDLDRLLIRNGYVASARTFERNNRIKRAWLVDDEKTRQGIDLPDAARAVSIKVDGRLHKTKSLRLIVRSIYGVAPTYRRFGSDTAVSEVAFFGR